MTAEPRDADRQGRGILLEPKARYRRVVDRYECPVCGERLGETRWDHNNQPGVRIYTDNTSRDMTRRVFHPCGCDDIIPSGHGIGPALVSSPADGEE